VDFISDASPKLIAIDEETDHEIGHGCRFGQAQRATHASLDPGPQIALFALGRCLTGVDVRLSTRVSVTDYSQRDRVAS
jgi:hypothetical protein